MIMNLNMYANDIAGDYDRMIGDNFNIIILSSDFLQIIKYPQLLKIHIWGVMRSSNKSKTQDIPQEYVHHQIIRQILLKYNIQQQNLQLQAISMTKNPNFFDNLNQNKITESVKLAYMQGGSDHDGRTAEQFLRYANGKQEHYEGGFQDKDVHPNIGIELGNNAKQIKTQYSQISHVESGFKKLKGNQVEILKELRNQYDMLRNLPSLEQKKQKPKSISSSSNQRISHREQSSSSSISSSKKYKNDKHSYHDNSRVNNREERLWMVERKQYEMIVSNCQQKIQQLLHNQLDYKKTIHQLKSALATSSSAKGTDNETIAKYELEVSSLKNRLSSQQSRARHAEKQLQKTKSQYKILQEKNIHFEGLLIGKDHDFSKYQDQIRRYEDTLRLEREKYHNTEIEKVKMVMQYEIMEKQKSQQLARLNKIIEQNNQHFQQNKKLTIQRLQDLIELKDERYRLLLAEYERLKKDFQQKEEVPIPQPEKNDQMQGLVLLMREYIAEKNNNQSHDMQRMIALLSEIANKPEYVPEREDNLEDKFKMLLEVRNLKDEIDKLKEMHAEDLQNYRNEVAKGYEAEIHALKETIKILQEKIREKSNYTPAPAPYQPANNQIFKLKRQINELENLLKEKDSLIRQLDENWKNYKQKWQRSEEELRKTKMMLDETRFENEKLRKQLEFKISVLQRENEAVVRMLQQELNNERRNVGHWRNEFQNIRRFYQVKIAEKNKLLESLESSTEIIQIKKQYDSSLEIEKAEYQRQIAQLADKLALLANNEKELEDFRRRYNSLQGSLYDIKLSYQRAKQLNDSVDHLWGIKEQEYHNIHTIVGQIRQNFSHIHQTHHHSMAGGMHSGFGFANQGNMGNMGASRNNIEGGIADGMGNLLNEGLSRNNIEGGIADGLGGLLGSRSQGNMNNPNMYNSRNNLAPPPPYPSKF